MDGFFARGGAVALLTIGVSLPLSAQGSGAAAGGGRVSRDTVVRVIDANGRVRMDSIRVLMRAIDGQPAMSEMSIKLRQELDAIVMGMRMAAPRGQARIIVQNQDGPAPFDFMHAKGWLGIMTGDAPLREEMSPAGHFVQYFAHPAIVSVDRESPAQLAGIVAGDSLIAYDGVDVVGRTLNLSQMLMPDRKLGITVRRAGENKDYQVTVARAPMTLFFRQRDPDDPTLPERVDRVYSVPRGEPREARPAIAGGFGGAARAQGGTVVGRQWVGGDGARGGAFTITNNGVFGARMSTLDAPAAKALGLQPGVLIQDVSEATAAARAGLLPGDIIVAVGGQPVTTLGDVQVASVRQAENRTVAFKIIREKKPRVINVTWSAPPTPPSPPSP